MTQHSHQYSLPAGCHDANTASELLGVSKKHLLKRMRELGWLLVGGDNHNLPRRDLVQRGLLTTQERAYPLKGNSEIVKNYRVMILTQSGFEALRRTLDGEANPAGAAQAGATVRPIERPVSRLSMTAEQRRAADLERANAMEHLRQMGMC